MVDRTRVRTLVDQQVTAETKSYLGSSYGNCTTSPGPNTSLWGFGAKSSTTPGLKIVETMVDVETPGFYRQRAEGKIINSPMTHTIVEERDVPASLTLDVYSNLYGCVPARWYPYLGIKLEGTLSVTSCLLSGSVFLQDDSGIDVEALQDLAINQAWSRIGHDEMLILSAIAESSSTLAGLVDIMKKVSKILRAIRSKNVKKLKRELALKELEELYMNARYNLRPLYYDAKAIYEILTGQVDKPGRQTYRGRKVASYQADDETTCSIFAQGGCSYSGDITRTYEHSVAVRSGVLTQSDSISQSQLLGIDSVVETAWDLIPFSFIVDWFTNVGETISAFTPNLGIDTLASWITVEETVTQKTVLERMNGTFFQSGSYLYTDEGYSLESGYVEKVTRTKTRIPNYRRDPIPNIDLNLDALKLFDLGIIMKNIRKNARYIR